MSKFINDTVKTIVSRYSTADPFVIAEKLNIEVDWCDLGDHPLGDTIYEEKEPIVLLNNNIKYSPRRNFVLAHEIGHVVMHADLNGYYTGRLSYGPLELQASEFASALMGMLFLEEHDRFPETIQELKNMYGLPM
ncbi:ImmA/IrrE family metallo-endopeptidase [Lentilactobacillus senioris]|uniref:ImmA/IrrE family metallo-endopeptidase n=1 Tax=Lentilactobacillus senioris TaxID=931534 RepID=UPI003D294E79